MRLLENEISVSARGHEVHLISIPALEETGFVRAAFTTRQNGVSEGPYASLNLGLGNADSEENKRENYRIAAEAMGCTEDDVVLSHQFHTTTVRVVTEEDRGKGTVKQRDYEDVDGLVTDVPGILLMTLHADCTPLYFVDPVHQAIGLAHSGWRGTVQRMGAVMIQTMAKEYGTDPKDVIAAIGPVISVGHYEIGPEVAQQFGEAFGAETCKEKDILRPGRGDRAFLNLEAANRLILEQAGVLLEHISASGLCTFDHADRFFSHRAVGGGERGNCAAMLVIQ